MLKSPIEIRDSVLFDYPRNTKGVIIVIYRIQSGNQLMELRVMRLSRDSVDDGR